VGFKNAQLAPPNNSAKPTALRARFAPLGEIFKVQFLQNVILRKATAMPLLSKDYLDFDKEDVQLMQDMMKKFHEMHRGTGMPDYSNVYTAYLPVFAIALLAAQNTVDRLTKELVWLTRGLVLLTVVLAVLTGVLLFR